MTTVDRQQLRWALKEAGRIKAPRPGTLPWASRVRVDSPDHNRLRITRTNLDVTVELEIPAAGALPAPTVVPARGLRRLVDLIDEDDVDVAVENPYHPDLADDQPQRLTVRAGAGSWRFASMHPDDWPAAPELAAAVTVDLKADTVAQLRRVAPAASHEDARPILTVVQVAGGTAAATDSYRLAVAELGDETKALPELLIPASFLRLCLRVDDGWTIAADGEYAQLRRDAATWTARLVQPHEQMQRPGRKTGYPDWRQLLPDDPGAPLSFDRARGRDVIRRAMAAAVDTPSAMPVTVATADGHLRVTAEHHDRHGTETLPCDGELPDGGVGLTPRYLLEGLEALDGAVATVHVRDPLKPLLFTEERFRYLLMPVRL